VEQKSKSGDARQQIVADHREIDELMTQITSGPGAAETRQCMRRLLPLLARHFREEEDQIDGVHMRLREQAPRHSHALEGLQREHVQLLELARELLLMADGGSRHLAVLGAQLRERLADHEAREMELFVDTVWTDLGAGG
jgi:hemerythrin